MKKLFITFILIMAVSLVSCGGNTTEVATTTDNELNTVIEIPSNLEISEQVILWPEVDTISQYEVLVKDVTTDNTDILLEDQYFTVSTNSFDATDLLSNRIYEISIRSILGEEHSVFSDPITLDKFIQTEIEWNYTFNVNSTDDFIAYFNQVPELFFIEEDGNELSNDNYYFEYDLLFIDNEYLMNFTTGVLFKLYTEQGIIDLNLQYTNTLVPFMRSDNTVEFNSEDILLVFELCGGTLSDISGNDITESDYTQVGNILIIDSDFVQALFDESPERNSVIISYQLRANDEIVIGFVFINRAD